MKHVQILRWCGAVILLFSCILGCKSQVKHAAGGGFTHVVIKDTVYYLDGPQQARPEDGSLTAGTKVRLVESGGSYSLIEEPVKAYVFTGDLQPLD